jgi:hypothetical protein
MRPEAVPPRPRVDHRGSAEEAAIFVAEPSAKHGTETVLRKIAVNGVTKNGSWVDESKARSLRNSVARTAPALG